MGLNKPLSLTDSLPTTGVLEIYKVSSEIFDKDRIHYQPEYLLIKKNIRVNIASHGIGRVISSSNRVKRKKNLVLDRGRRLIADTMAGRVVADPITKFAVGSGGYIGEPDLRVDPPEPLGTDERLNAEIFEKDIDSIEQPNMAANTYIGYLAENEINGQILTEWCLKSLAGIVFSRATTRPIPKEPGFVYVIRWTIQH